MISLKQLNTLKLGEAKEPIKGLTAKKWQKQDTNPGHLTVEHIWCLP